MPSTQPIPAATCKRGHAEGGGDLRVGAASQQQLHEIEIAGLRRAKKRGRAVLVEPLVREDGADLGAVLGARVDVGALVEEQPDELEVVHVAPADGVVAVLDVAVVGREVQRRPSALVGEVRVGAVLQQIRAELVVAVLCRDQQRTSIRSR